LKKLGEILETFIEKNRNLERLKIFPIIAAWKEIVGENIAMKAKVYDFRKGELIIVCDDPMWRVEMELRKDYLVKKMNEYIGRELVKKIDIWRGYHGR